MMVVKTSDPNSIKPFLKNLYLPSPNSHKGQNGRVLIIGGSSLFHAASLWAAEVASHFVDIVHYSSTVENNEIFLSWKKKFRNGIVIRKKDLLFYVDEDDSVLVGPGMVREDKNPNFKFQISKQVQNLNFQNIIELKDEGEYTLQLTKYLIGNFPNKKFVFDAGALQMLDKNWLGDLKTQPILTPHHGEFKRLFGVGLTNLPLSEKQKIVEKHAKKHKSVILLKSVVDVISDGYETIIVEGGNAGLTKGGTGDVLAGLTVAFYAKNDPLTSSVLASYILKGTADELFKSKGYWYNIDDIIENIPIFLKKLKFDKSKLLL